MRLKKVLAFVSSLCMLSSGFTAFNMNVEATRTTSEKYGDDTYANRFMSLYADVIENGEKNGYLSTQDGKEIPYHCVETLNIDSTTDYGHETTSQDMSYLVLVSAMKDNIVNKDLTTATNAPTSSSELASAWSDMETLVPTTQTGFWSNANKGNLSTQYSNESDYPEDYPFTADAWNTAVNPIQSYFTSAYSSDSGLYLMHWLADTNDWYGFGASTAGKEDGTVTLIDSFERGCNESVWETVPHACVEELKYGNVNQGIKGGIFNTSTNTAKQYTYKSTPVAEDRAIQAVHDSIRWGVANSSVTTLAGKMGDEARNTFFDKYYKAISNTTSPNSSTTGYESSHYLRGWNTTWGGALDGSWAWQIGSSVAHQGYQNPLTAYALISDSSLNSAMKALGATQDYKTSLGRQLEFYLWLQSADGPIAGGATNSLNGRYESYSGGYTYTPNTGSSKYITSTFYGMIYLEHPAYEDYPSNESISTQVESLQRIAELYYDVAQLGDNSGGVKAGGLSIEEACEKLMDKWVDWSLENIKFDDDAVDILEQYSGSKFTGDTEYAWAIPSTLTWDGQPDTWTGDGTHDNDDLTCNIMSYSQSVGDTATWANSLIYYAAAKGVNTNTTKSADELIASNNKAEQALGYAKKLLDYQWESSRDNIGMSQTETQSNLTRFFEQEVYVPTTYHGTMPNGDPIESGSIFLSIRTAYTGDTNYSKLKSYYDNGTLTTATWTYHRFSEQCEVLMANGVMATLFPSISVTEEEEPVVTTTETTTTTPVTTTTQATTTTTTPVTTTTQATTTTTTPVTTTTQATTTTTTPVTTTTQTTTTTTAPVTTTTQTTTTTTETTSNGDAIVLGQDGWNFDNTYSAFSSNIRYISEDDFDKLLSKLNNIDRTNAEILLEKEWNGSCYGMSLTTILAEEGIFDVNAWDSTATYLSDLPVLTAEYDTAEESLINYYHVLQATQTIQEKITATLNESNAINVKKLLSLVETVEDGETPVFICYQQGDFAHAIVGYGIENVSTVIDGTSYQKRIKVLDPNNSTLWDDNDNFCIYVNTKNNNWCIPKYGISSEKGAEFMLIENDLSILDQFSYFSDDVNTTGSTINVGILKSSLISTFNISKISKSSDGTINSGVLDDDDIKIFYDFDTSTDSSADSFKATLKDVTSGYKFDTLNTTQSLDLSMMYPECQLSATSSKGKYVNFFPNGDINISVDNSDFSLGVVFNDSEMVFDWYNLEVSGNKINQATLSPCEDGFILSGDNLVNITVSAKNLDASAQTTFTTTEDSVFIYEIDEHTIGVSVDTDGDGEYETALDTFTAESVTVGDINGDGEVLVTDLLLLKKHVLQMSTLDGDALTSADINGDGEVLANDLLLLKRILLQIITWDDISK